MSNNNIIQLEDNLCLREFECTPEKLMNKSILLVGSRNSGKTCCTIDLMHVLKDMIPICIVFNATESSNCCFGKIVSSVFLHTEINLDKISEIWRRQEITSNIYKLVNDIDHLRGIINLYNISNFDKSFQDVSDYEEKTINNIKDKERDNNVRLVKISKAQTKFKELKIELCKKFVEEIKKKIENKEYSDDKLNDEQKLILKYIKINPNVLLIFDDCSSILKSMMNTHVIRKLFYQARHVNITFIITAQDDIDIASSLRKNANIIFLCDTTVTNSYFERASNGFNNRIKQLTKRYSDTLFKKPYLKLVYDKDDINNRFTYYLPKIHESFQFGSEEIQEYINKVKKKNNSNIVNLLKNI